MDLLFAAEQYAAAQVRLSLFICSKIWSTNSYSGDCSSCSSILCECSKCSNECGHWWSKPKDGAGAWPGNNTSSTSWYHKTPGTKMSPDDAARHDDGSDGPSTKVTIMFKVWKHWKQISCQKWHSSALDPKCLSHPTFCFSQTWSGGNGAPPPPSMSRSNEHDDRDERDYERRRRRERSRERGRGRSRSRSRSHFHFLDSSL